MESQPIRKTSSRQVQPSFIDTSQADAAYAQIRERILDGTLWAGSRLNQHELADEMGISITPLREPVRRLSGEGCIEFDAHKNTRVAEESHPSV